MCSDRHDRFLASCFGLSVRGLAALGAPGHYPAVGQSAANDPALGPVRPTPYPLGEGPRALWDAWSNQIVAIRAGFGLHF